MDFQSAVKSGLNKYVSFSGRASRSEYWWFFLFTILAQIAGAVVDGIIGTGFISGLIGLGLFLPGLGLGFRRIHDIDKSAWWLLIFLVPLVGFILLIVWFCSRGTQGDNRFGADPLGKAA